MIDILHFVYSPAKGYIRAIFTFWLLSTMQPWTFFKKNFKYFKFFIDKEKLHMYRMICLCMFEIKLGYAWPRLALNLQSRSLYLTRTRITGVSYYTGQCDVFICVYIMEWSNQANYHIYYLTYLIISVMRTFKIYSLGRFQVPFFHC